MNHLKSLAFLLFFPVAAIAADAKIEFESSRFEASAEIGQAKVPFEFSFQNTGDGPVEITDVRTSSIVK